MTYDIHDLLAHLDPARLDYEGWISVGMALKDEGLSAADWDQWSQRDPARYHAGECERKWKSFAGSAKPVTVGTIVQLAREQGYNPPRVDDYALDWDAEIVRDDDEYDHSRTEKHDVPPPPADDDWHPARQLIRYLELLFEASETVNYVTESWWSEEKQKFQPSKGAYDRTAGELIQALSGCGDDIGAVLGDYKAEVGAWIRFNPLDGKGVKNENVTEHRYALVESDSQDIDRQYAIIRELELPVAVLVHSGGKSLHAIVHINAADKAEYKKRVTYLYSVCEKNGLKIDRNSRNPSRLSRMPGATRNGNKQYIVAEGMGKKSYDEWYEWVEARPEVSNKKPVKLVAAADVPYEPPQWLIKPYLQLKATNMLQGEPGTGKTAYACFIAAHVSTGTPLLPDCPIQEPGNVIVISVEDAPGQLRGRIEADGGDLSKCYFIEEAAKLTFLSPEIEQAIQQVNAKLVIFDPMQNFFGRGVDMHRSNETRPILSQLCEMAARNDCAVLIIAHLGKNQSGKTAVNASLGSTDIPAAMRSIVHIARNPADDTEVVAIHVKSNASRKGKPIAYEIGERGRVTIRGYSKLDEYDLQNMARSQEKAVKYDSEPLVQVFRQLTTDSPGGGFWSYPDFKEEGAKILGFPPFGSLADLRRKLSDSNFAAELMKQDGLIIAHGAKGTGGIRGIRISRYTVPDAYQTKMQPDSGKSSR